MHVDRIHIENRADWLELRKRDVTASDVAALFGVSRFKTRLGLWMEKSGRASEDEVDNKVLRRGRLMEPSVAVAVTEEHPDWKVEKATEYLRSPEHRAGATLDYRVRTPEDGGPLECKVVDPGVFERDWQGGECVPDYYDLQVRLQMLLDGAAVGYVAALVVNRSLDLHVFRIERNEAVEQAMLDEIKAFWESVTFDKQPAPEFGREAANIKRLYPADGGAPLDLKGDNRMSALLVDRERLKAAEKAIGEELAAVEDEVRMKIGDAPAFETHQFRGTYKAQTRKSYTVKESTSRVLRVTKLS